MTPKHLNFFWWLCVAFFASVANAQSMSPDMRGLCDRAGRTEFVPLPESVTSPSPDFLFNAIEMGADYKSVQSLIEDKNPDKIVIQGVTPLMLAALTGNWPAAQALIDKGADVNLEKPDLFTTPLMAVVIRSKYSVACKLIDNHARLPTLKLDRGHFFSNAQLADPNSQNDAAIFVDYLLSNGFDSNDKGTPGETPLMGAVSLSNIPVIKVLLKHGARLDTVTKDGRTVWTVARKKNNPQVIQLLEEAQKKAAAGKTKAPASKELVVQ